MKKAVPSTTRNTAPLVSSSYPEIRSQPWYDGRRIVELSTLANNLATCTGKTCELPQDLRNIERETRCGLGSILYIRCRCGILNSVKTCRTHQSSKGRPVFDVNTACAAAMIHAGMSHASLQKFTSSLDIHPPDRKTLKRKEHEIRSDYGKSGARVMRRGNRSGKASGRD